MRQPSILDVVSAVKRVSRSHPEVTAWWYIPPQRLRLGGGEMPTIADTAGIEVVIEGGGDPAAIAAELTGTLRTAPVSVRPHRGGGHEGRLFRLMSRAQGAT
jgi:hypothetical protein